MISEAFTVGTTAIKIISSSSIERVVYIHALGTGTVYLGGSNVTTTNGLQTEKNDSPLVLTIPQHEELFAISGDGIEDVRVLRTTADGN